MYHIFSSNITIGTDTANQTELKKRFNSKIMFIVVFGIIFHVVFTLSIFDIYFRSPLVHGMTPHKIDTNVVQPPASRLVLFVADGLRADKFFEIENGKSRAPFLRDIIENKGSWGVSHTRVPTETRPGHVAMIAGFYEDVSAVTKGWKSNPVDFDHVFNESTYSWGYGSPDVVPMFSDKVDHMFTECYPPEAEDFGGDASKLDTWTFDKIEQLFQNASKDQELMKKLKSEKVVIFLHLLGLDTNGHAYRPNSKEYYDNIGLVDRGIEKISKMIDQFYGDGNTAYIFTSDHGMSNRGSHGDGERANTETPLVAWGSGVRGPLSYKLQFERITKLRGKARESLPVDPSTPSSWELSHLMRSDVSQADIAPLMTSLIGIPSPLNSVGVLPTDYLGTDIKYTSHALYANTLQIWEMFKLKSDTKRDNSLIFAPFTKLNNAQQTLATIKDNLDKQQYEDAQVHCIAFIELCLQGLNYFQTYDRPFLMTMITLGYFGWIITLSLYVMNNYTIIGSRLDKEFVKQKISTVDKISNYLIIILSIGLYGYLLVNESPILYYIYCTFVILFWGKSIPSNILPLYLFLQSSSLKSPSNSILENKSGIIRNFIILAISAFLVMELLVISYFERKVLSLLFILLGLSTFTFKISTQLRVYWMVSCILMSIFPMLPVDYGSDTTLVCIGGLLISLIGFSSQIINPNNIKPSNIHKNIVYGLIITITFASWIVYNTDKSLEKKIGLPYFNQIASWTLFLSSFVILAVLKGKHYFYHWIYLCLTLAIPFVLFSVAYETLFYGCFIVTLSIWMYTELKLENEKLSGGTITQNDIKRAIIYIFFCYIGFFGVGNIASISSFEISSTYRFTTIFDPFLMGVLLLVKIFIPLLIVALSFSLLNNSLNIPRPASFLVVIALTDIMNINFFFLVKDTGSWLEIGISISHYAISNAFIILQLLLFAVSSALVPTTIQSSNKIKK